jgi:outer membrane immunogenic protein
MKRVLSAPVALLALSTLGTAAAKAADVYPPGPAPLQAGPGPIQPSYPPVVAPYPPVVAPIPFCWTGFFVGANFGFAWVNDDFVDRNGNTFTITNSGFIGGGQVGYNYQIGNFVFGAEWMFDATSLDLPVVAGISANTKWVTTFAGRFGWAWDRWLAYGKVGGGVVGTDITIANLNGGSVTTSNDNTGLLVGAGVEWAFAPSWTVKLEYDFLALNSLPVISTTAPAIVVDSSGNNHNLQMFTVGVNYLFNWGPLRY